MTPRTMTRMRRLATTAVALSLLVSLAGCDPRTIFYFLQPFEPTIPAPGPSLKGKKVVVLTAADDATLGRFPGLERDLARQFIGNLKKNKKITTVDNERVGDWIQGHPKWSDPSEAARDFEADVVIVLEIEMFQTRHPGSLNVLEGSAKVHIQAFELAHPKNSKGKPITDQPKESESIYDDYQETTFPIRGPIPMDSGVGESTFKNKLLQVVADECSWHFIEHSQGDVIQDVRFNGR
ncbi:hypothetical protein [Planctomyces sp. SH-PL62]|uniref:hypothetical protein n=1 Tax=Planctomyces sp. SH-PL62 TaxID=1636152 RepID=UPI00078EEAFB|nr:hypothetical protein [Planctomyces sp. SH-PL62]AMV37043.1 hypothetical protein VT85_06400 [Planctomyces sp. SH-PL62]